MPLAHVYVGGGRADQQQKAQSIAQVTEVFSQVLGSDPKKVWIVLHDVPRSQWCIDGKPREDPDAEGERR